MVYSTAAMQRQQQRSHELGTTSSEPETPTSEYTGSSVEPPSRLVSPQSGKAPKGDKARHSTTPLGKEGPVKAACLSCRSKKAKCDGVQPVCGACVKKGLTCEYVKSRRGGPRKRRQPPPSALQQFLAKLDSFVAAPDQVLPFGEKSDNEDTTDVVRTFSSRDEIFRCYYNEVHAFLPVMPQRKWLKEVLPSLLPQSPFLLAASCILMLVPHPRDPAPASPNSKRLRSAASHQIALEAETSINRLVNTGRANIECVQALTMLSLWQWGTTLDLNQTKAYSAQAITIGMQLGLHELDQYSPSASGSAVESQDWQKDMSRRTWWVTFGHQLQTAQASGSTSVISHDDPRIQVDFPACSIDDKSWSQHINTIRECSRVIDVLVSVYYAGDASKLGTATNAEVERRRKMFDVDAGILNLLRQAEAKSVIDFVSGGEEEVIRNQQLASRLAIAVLHIHVHRHQAFPEVSLFSKMMCGLPEMPPMSTEPVPAPLNSNPAPVGLAPNPIANESSTIQALMPQQTTMDLSSIDSPLVPQTKTFPDTYLYSDSAYAPVADDQDPFAFINDMWQPETYPETLPEPWFVHSGGAGELYNPIEMVNTFQPPLTATLGEIESWSSSFSSSMPSSSLSPPTSSSLSVGSSGQNDLRADPKNNSPGPSMTSAAGNNESGQPTTDKRHQAWGVDANDKPEIPDEILDEEQGVIKVFPPGVSLERCATAAHAIIRLEVLHRSAVMAMSDGPPRWLPFCSCGLVTGAYAFLLLALAVQASNAYRVPDGEAVKQIEGLLTNVKVIVAGLEGYGIMWEGIGMMAREVRAALEAAARLPEEMRAQMSQYANAEDDQQEPLTRETSSIPQTQNQVLDTQYFVPHDQQAYNQASASFDGVWQSGGSGSGTNAVDFSGLSIGQSGESMGYGSNYPTYDNSRFGEI